MKFRNHLLSGLVLTLLPAPLLACFCDVPPRFAGLCPTLAMPIMPFSWARQPRSILRGPI